MQRARAKLDVKTFKLKGLQSANMVSLAKPAPIALPTEALQTKGVIYYHKRPKDCLFATRNLSTLEQHAFDRLELNYMDQGGLSGNLDDMVRLLRYKEPGEITALKYVLDTFYLLTGGKYQRQEYDVILSNVASFKAARAVSGSKGGKAPRQKNAASKPRRMPPPGYKSPPLIKLSAQERAAIL